MSWPNMFQVTFRSVDGLESSFPTLTFLGVHKAVAMAAQAHDHFYGWQILDVVVQGLGPAPRNPDGTVGQGPPGVLEDRSEF